MRATNGGRPFTDLEWVYEVKYDGYRCLSRVGGGQPVELRTKSGVERTKWFPEVADVLAQLPGGPHVIDGEACVLDDS
jgi:ATP-dependent DNA ligase